MISSNPPASFKVFDFKFNKSSTNFSFISFLENFKHACTAKLPNLLCTNFVKKGSPIKLHIYLINYSLLPVSALLSSLPFFNKVYTNS